MAHLVARLRNTKDLRANVTTTRPVKLTARPFRRPADVERLARLVAALIPRFQVGTGPAPSPVGLTRPLATKAGPPGRPPKGGGVGPSTTAEEAPLARERVRLQRRIGQALTRPALPRKVGPRVARLSAARPGLVAAIGVTRFARVGTVGRLEAKGRGRETPR